jgi:hypothetical protein
MTLSREARPNPYVGPRPLQTGEPLFGRDREVRYLRDLLIVEQIVLLYSPPGAGKTSLIQAGLIPELREKEFHVLPIIRVGRSPPLSEAQPPAAPNRYTDSTLLALEEGLPEGQRKPLSELAGVRLADYLDTRSPAADPPDEVLIFDQFEEILALDPSDIQAKDEFFTQLGEALRGRQRWALFAVREDFVPALDPYLPRLPWERRATYRLDRLSPAAARQAIQRAARGVGVDFGDEAAMLLIDDMRRLRVERDDGSVVSVPGSSVEPLQVQVVCRRLWENLPADVNQVTAADVARLGEVDQALAGYYAERVASIARVSNVTERFLREWVGRHLITAQGTRGQVRLSHAESRGLDNEALLHMADANLVRIERRHGTTWVELAHDRLIEPILKDNAAWQQSHLAAWQLQARLWEEHGRQGDLLLSGTLLGEAKAWAGAHPDDLTPMEVDFLSASQQNLRKGRHRKPRM